MGRTARPRIPQLRERGHQRSAGNQQRKANAELSRQRLDFRAKTPQGTGLANAKGSAFGPKRPKSENGKGVQDQNAHRLRTTIYALTH